MAQRLKRVAVKRAMVENMNSNRLATRRIPQRTCVACRKVRDKRELVRLVRISDGSVEVDTSGKKPGRGAYLCQTRECWETGLKTGRLEHTLRTSISQDNRERLVSHGKDIPQGVG